MNATLPCPCITPARSIARRSFRTGWSQIRSSTASISFSCGIAEKQGFAQNQIRYELVALACEPLAWTQMLALTGTARRWEPKRLRLRLFAIAARLARGSRRLRLRLAQNWPWAADITAAITRLQAIPSG